MGALEDGRGRGAIKSGSLVFGEFLNLFPDAAIVIDPSEHVALANTRAAEIFRRRLPELAGMPLTALFDDAPRFACHLRENLVDRAGSGAATREWTALRGDGGSLPVDVAHRIIELDGKSMILAVLRDMTERKRIEDELRKSEERLRQAARVSEIGIFDHDHRTDTHHWSSRQREMYGWPEDEPVTVPTFLARLHPDDRDAIADGIRRAHDPGGDGSFDVEHRIIRSDGEVRWISTRSTTVFSEEGGARRPLRTVGASIDFTERKQAEEGRERLAAILDATPDLVGIADPRGKLLYFNRAARLFLGIDLGDDLSTRGVADRIPEAMRRLVVETALPAAMKNGVWMGETAILDDAGREVPFSQVVLAHKRADGEVAFLSTVARDISREKNLEAQFLQAQKMEAIGRMAGGVAHDFNNLLSVILGFAGLAFDNLPEGHPSRADIEEIKRAGERAAELTRQMLAFGRKQVLRPRVVNVNEVLSGMAPMMRRLIGEHIDLVAKLAADLGRIKADPNHLEQVMLNLVVNARDAMPEGGTLTLETQNVFLDEGYARAHLETKPGPYVMIAVSDTGVGMDAATEGRIFEPFFTTKEPGEGTGLGLSMVFGIVKQSGGDISVDSELGRGTIFRLCFPRTDELARPETVAPPQAPVASDGATVLLVEDETQLRKLVATVLRGSGYNVLVASGPLEALALAHREKKPIDLLLTDVVMPQMSGKKLAVLLTAERPETRVLYTSGYAENDAGPALSGTMLAKEVHFLPKPITPTSLLAMVRRALEN
jgi:two-component system, cell cycle sensor histidine kinase and response regulator CckA